MLLFGNFNQNLSTKSYTKRFCLNVVVHRVNCLVLKLQNIYNFVSFDNLALNRILYAVIFDHLKETSFTFKKHL